MNDQPQNNGQPPKPKCGNCRFTEMLPNNLKQVECHWGPPSAGMISQPGPRPGTMVMQKYSTWPVVDKQHHCHRHELRILAVG